MYLNGLRFEIGSGKFEVLYALEFAKTNFARFHQDSVSCPPLNQFCFAVFVNGLGTEIGFVYASNGAICEKCGANTRKVKKKKTFNI